MPHESRFGTSSGVMLQALCRATEDDIACLLDGSLSPGEFLGLVATKAGITVDEAMQMVLEIELIRTRRLWAEALL